MLRGFSVSNFKSFHETQSLSMAAGKIQRHGDHVETIGNRRRILRSAAVFGANGGGKTNLIEAMAFSRNVIVDGLDSVGLRNPYFRGAKDCVKKPGVFQYDLFVDGREYSYGIAVSYAKHKIVSEWLVRCNPATKSEVVLFDRNEEDEESTVITDIEDADSRRKVYYGDFCGAITDALRKKTMLADLSERSVENGVLGEIHGIYNCFRNFTILSQNMRSPRITKIAADEQQLQLFETLLASFDTGIASIEEEERAVDRDELLTGVPAGEADLCNSVTQRPVLFSVNGHPIFLAKCEDGSLVCHKVLLNHGNQDELFEVDEESEGTRRLFDLIPLLYSAEPRIILIDELDQSLHTNLVRRYLELFFQFKKGTGTQIIFTTQDSNLMDLELFRQDEIWFVERQKDHSSKLYSLNQYKVRFDKVVRDDYLIGRYGAVPTLKDMSDEGTFHNGPGI